MMRRLCMDIAPMIDHTLLSQDATEQMIEKLCDEAKAYGFAAVCVNPHYVGKAARLLKDTDGKVATVIGFPLGANIKEVKAFEALKAVGDGADEIDMVMNISALKNRKYLQVEEDIRAVVDAVEGQATVKVIIEACLLSTEEKIKACEITRDAGAHFVKTSTGFATGGALIEDVELMYRAVGDEVRIKAAGGIRDYDTARAMIDAGASRIGASASVDIISGYNIKKRF